MTEAKKTTTNKITIQVKIEELNNKGNAQVRYTSPRAKVVEMNIRGLLCASEKQGAGNATEFEPGGENW